MAQKPRRPLIGIGGRVIAREGGDFGVVPYSYNSVIAAGGLLVHLPPRFGKELLDEYFSLIDGLMTIDGEVVDPGLYGESIKPECGTMDRECDTFEMSIAKLALERNLLEGSVNIRLIKKGKRGGTQYEAIKSCQYAV